MMNVYSRKSGWHPSSGTLVRTSFPLSVELKQIVEGGNEKDSEFPAYAFLTRALVPTYGQISKKTMQALLERRLMRYTLELRRHRVRTGSYPATLDELVTPEGFPDPVDPIDEKPLVYERKGSGFRLTVARRKVWWSSSKDEESFEQGVIILSR